MKIGVVVATYGRIEEANDLVGDLAAQSRPPDRLVFAVTRLEDAPDPTDFCEVLKCTRQGSCAQRNAGIELVQDAVDVILFLDDDFVPGPRYLEVLESVFEEHPEVVGLTGRVIADGATGRGISRADAMTALSSDTEPLQESFKTRWSLYGCNMAVRSAVLGELRFDESLPLYGWLEDMDLSYQLGWSGRLLQVNGMIGVHRGVKRGRTSGVRFGYSQVANPVHLLRKKSAPTRTMFENMAWNICANTLKSIRPEPYIDRRGRLKGNLIAIGDILRRRCRPERILDLG